LGCSEEYLEDVREKIMSRYPDIKPTEKKIIYDMGYIIPHE
jgi:hypothetical protein